jgi:hypothetical protein
VRATRCWSAPPPATWQARKTRGPDWLQPGRHHHPRPAGARSRRVRVLPAHHGGVRPRVRLRQQTSFSCPARR